MKKINGFMHGINIGGWLSQSPLNREHLDGFITEKDLMRIAEMRFDHIRLPIDYELICSEDGFKYIDTAVSLCGRYGLNIVLDLHKTAGYAFYEQNGNSFFESKELQDKFCDIWRELSERYGRYGTAAFDLLNEITDPAVSEQWNSIAAQAVSVIRKNAPHTPILIGGVCYNSINAVKGILYPPDDSIVYSFHFYEPYIFTHQGADWEKNMTDGFRIGYPLTAGEYKNISKEKLKGEFSGIFRFAEDNTPVKEIISKLFAEAASTAEERNVPLYCGEYGVIDKADAISALSWHRDIRDIFDRFGIGRALWCYKGMSFGLIDRHYDEVRGQITEIIN